MWAGDNYNFKRLLPEQGLPAGDVRKILQDSRGFIWFGTTDGLARYDGLEFRTFRHDPKDPGSLANNDIWDVVEDPRGNLWIATQSGGLDCWERRLEVFRHFEDNPAIGTSSIRRLLANQDGSLWLGTIGAGLILYDPATNTSRQFAPAPGEPGRLSNGDIRCLFRDREGGLWIGTHGGGLNRFDPKTGRFQVYLAEEKNPHSLIHNIVRTLAEDRQGFLWVGTASGLCRLDPPRRRFDRFPFDPLKAGLLQTPVVESILADAGGRLWIGTDGGGISLVDPVSLATVPLRHHPSLWFTLSSNVIRHIFQDRAGDYWIGNAPSGVNFASRLAIPFHSYQAMACDARSLSHETISSFLEEGNGLVWVGTDKAGLDLFDLGSGRVKNFRHDPGNPNSLGANNIATLMKDWKGRLWVGAWNGGVSCLDPVSGKVRRFLPEEGNPNSLSDARVWGLAEDQQHRIWIATGLEGLDRLDPANGTFKHYRAQAADPHSLPHNTVWTVLVSRDGRVWAGTQEGIGVWQPETDSWRKLGLKSTGSPAERMESVVDLLEDRRGQIWAGTQNGGLFRLDPTTGKMEHFSREAGLPSDSIAGILEDDDGFLWVSTNNGLARLDPAAHRISIYDQNHGIPQRQFIRRSRLRLRSGELLFGGTQGFVRVDPRRVHPNPVLPEVVLTRLEIFNQEVLPAWEDSLLLESISEARQLRIPARQSVLTFQFAILDYRSPERNQCLFKLEGFDRDWRKAGPERRATYTNLSPGKYVLRLRGGNHEGIWNDRETTLDLIIIPPFYQTWWFEMLVATLLVVGLVSGGWSISHFRLRRRLQEAAREKEIARERQKAAEALQEREEKFRSTLASMNDLVFVLDRQGVFVEYHTPNNAPLLASPEHFLGRHYQETLPPALAVLLEDALNHLSAGDRIPALDYELELGGKQTWWSANISPRRNSAGEIVGATIVSREITDRRQAEAQLLQANKMESIGRLAGGVAHDLNNMLSPILGYTEMMKEDLPADSPLQASMSEVLQAAERSRDLVHQLLAFARKQTLEMKPLDLNRVIEDFLKMLRRTLRENVAIETRLDPDLPLILADARQIEQVLLNLSVNGQDAMPSGGTLFISTYRTILDDEYARQHEEVKPGRFVQLAVSDTGTGIDRETLKHCFEPFFTTKERGHGTGLGLATVYGIAKQHGGHVGIYSELGQGTTVRLYLPESVEQTPLPLPVAEEAVAEPRSSGTLLLVEDEEQVRTLAAQVLARAGYSILEASSGKAAIEQMRVFSAPIDLLITDIVLPDMNGKQLYENLCSSQPGLAVLFMSGYTSDVITHHGVLDEGIDFIHKPFNIKALLAKVRQVLRQE